MPFGTEYTAALTTAGSQGLLRAALTGRSMYFLAADEDPEDFTPLDATGAVVPIIGFQEKLFWLDVDDVTTAHDGVTCLVTQGGYRYKYEGTNLEVKSVLEISATPPGLPALGDKYLVDTAATGAWATHDDDVAIYTSRGWLFKEPSIGDAVLVEDTDVWWSYRASGVWAAGFGATPIAANSVLPTSILAGRSMWIVENQTTNAPPSVADGSQYIIGPSPTGVWAGHAAKLAMAHAASTDGWIIVTPTEGVQAYDKALDIVVVYRGGWLSAAGAWVGFGSVKTDGTGSTSAGGAGAWNGTSTPTTSLTYLKDDATLAYTAKRTGSTLRFNYRAEMLCNAAGFEAGFALFRDAEANALDWVRGQSDAFNYLRGSHLLQTTALDASAHTYHIRGIRTSTLVLTSLARRIFQIEEAA